MKQTSGFISTYSADAFGVCSALYELGGMVVMHDASGCNSTYTTHDEPRWYDMDSMVYISGLTEIEAIMGDDSKLIEDVVSAAEELHPKFIAIVGTTIPAMTGFDADAAARVIEERTGIKSFGFSTTGMKSYVHGASMAFEALADNIENICSNNAGDSDEETCLGLYSNKTDNKIDNNIINNKINILGLTPLDFSVNGSDRSIKKFYESKGYEVISGWAMGSSLEDIKKAGRADLNIVVSETGIGAAQKLKDKFGIPYKVGIPIGYEDIDVTEEFALNMNDQTALVKKISTDYFEKAPYQGYEAIEILVMGERVSSLSLAKYLSIKTGKICFGYATTDSDEDEIITAIAKMKNLKTIIADPLFKPVLRLAGINETDGIKFISLPHEAFSGRIYRADIPDMIENIDLLMKKIKKIILKQL